MQDSRWVARRRVAHARIREEAGPSDRSLTARDGRRRGRVRSWRRAGARTTPGLAAGGFPIESRNAGDAARRLGFVVSLARNARSSASLPNSQRDAALEQLESTLKRSLLAKEEALGEVKLSDAEHKWLKAHRPKEARDWNLRSE